MGTSLVSDEVSEKLYDAPVTGQDDTLSPQEVSDRLRIHDLLVTYAAAVDDRDWEGLRSVFTKDAVLDYTVFGGPRGGLDEAVEWLSNALQRVAMTQHLITNVRIHLGSDTADVRSYVFNPLGTNEKVVLVGGHYRDRAERTSDGWRIAERVAQLTWSDRPVKPGKQG
jgi:3-phenylpropionate/cinnamic acid dioxygenase small subunit